MKLTEKFVGAKVSIKISDSIIFKMCMFPENLDVCIFKLIIMMARHLFEIKEIFYYYRF